MAGEAQESSYAAFLLRVWHNDTSDDWRLVIEEIGSEARRGFTNWEELVIFARNCVCDPEKPA